MKNSGKAAAAASKLGYLFGGGASGVTDVRALAPGETATAVVSCPSNGIVDVGATADEDHTGDRERRAEQRVLSQGRTASSRRRLRPDLVVTQVYGDQVNASNECTIFADVKNIGTASAPATMTAFRDAASPPADGVGFNSQVSTPALSPGAEHYGQLRSDLRPGQHGGGDRGREPDWSPRVTRTTTPTRDPGSRTPPAGPPAVAPTRGERSRMTVPLLWA